MLFLLAYGLAYWAGISFYFEPEHVATCWPANGLVVGVLLVTPYRQWPVLLGLQAVLQLSLNVGGLEAPFAFAVCATVANTVAVATTAFATRRACRGGTSTGTMRHVVALVVAALVGEALGAVIGTVAVSVMVPGIGFWAVWQVWWFADVLGVLLLAPIVVGWAVLLRSGEAIPANALEALVQFVATLIVAQVVFAAEPGSATSVMDFPVLVVPLLLWGAWRLAPPYSALEVLLVGILVLAYADAGRGPFVDPHQSVHELVLAVQTFLTVACVTTLCLAALVAERRLAVGSLTQSQDHYRSVLEASPDAIIVFEFDGRVAYLNPMFTRIFGWSLEECIGHTLTGFVPEALAIDDWELRDAVGRGERIAPADTQRLRKDGEPVDVSLTAAPHLSDQGERHGCVMGLRDITQRKRAEQARDRLSAALEQASEAVVVTDRSGNIVYVNPACERHLAPSTEPAVGANLSVLLTELMGGSAPAGFDDAIANGTQWRGKLVFSGPTGEHTDETTLTPMYAASGEVVGHVAVSRDVTEELILQQQLQQSRKLEAIGTLAGGIAHDFNNILSAILGYTELAITNADHNSALKADLDAVLNATSRAKELVRQLLTFARRQPLDVRPIAVATVSADVVRLLRASLPSSIELDTDLESDTAVVADPTQVHQILMNLGTNAGLAMEDRGGRLEITVHDQLVSEQFASLLPGLRAGAHVVLTVADSGCGMPPEVLERIFEPFFTTRPNELGTGLGLSVVHGIVKDLGGAIRVRSAVGRGSTFEVFFPTALLPAEKAEAVDSIIPHGTERVLFVDDEAPLARLASKQLGALGYRVRATTKSLEALQWFRAAPDDFDIVVTDLTMPFLAGDALALEMLTIRPDLPVLLCTGRGDAETQARAHTIGVRAVVAKPSSLREMAVAMRRVLDRVELGVEPGRSAPAKLPAPE